VLLCAGILGRYYTDSHNVDEDADNIPTDGGDWYRGTDAGITCRWLTDTFTRVFDTVASRKYSLHDTTCSNVVL